MTAAEPRYVGLATRGVAFVIDAALINVVGIVVAAGASLIVSVLHLPKDVKDVIVAVGGAAYILWSFGYFVGFWSATGQTPGDRIMQIRVIPVSGERLKPRRAAVRAIGLVLAALPLFAGYALILFDDRRRGLQDRLARTLVVEAPSLSFAAQRRARSRAAYDAASDAARGLSPGAGETRPAGGV